MDNDTKASLTFSPPPFDSALQFDNGWSDERKTRLDVQRMHACACHGFPEMVAGVAVVCCSLCSTPSFIAPRVKCPPDCPKHVYHHPDEMCPAETPLV